jgi:hypothetical protein
MKKLTVEGQHARLVWLARELLLKASSLMFMLTGQY